MGVTWTAYGAPAYERLVEAVGAAKRDDPLAPVTVLVPSNVCGIAARRRLAAGVNGRGGVAGLAVLTVDRLAERIAAPTLVGDGRRPTTGPVLAAAWRSALGENPGVFEPVAGHPATVRALVNAHRELRDLDEKGLAAIERRGGTVQRELVRLHRDVLMKLTAFYDVADLRRAALEVLQARPDREIGAVVLFLPQDLTQPAADLVRQLAPASIVAGHTGVARADAAILRTLQRLKTRTAAPEGVLPPVARQIRHASDADDEVRVVLREVVTALRTVPAHRVAVLYGCAHPYARLLAEHLGAAGLIRSGAGVRPTIERALARLLLDLLALPAHGWRRDEVMSVLARATVRTAQDRRLPASAWERLSREAGVVAGEDWDVRLGRYAEELAPEHPDRSVSVTALREFVLDLRAALQTVHSAQTWPELAQAARAAYTKVTGELETTRLPEDENRAAQRIHSTLSGLAGLGVLEDRADVQTLRGALELELADDLPRHGRFGTGVYVAPLSEAVGLDVDAVFVVGLADDLLPGRLDPDALLDDETRALGGLPPLRDRLDRAHRHLLVALADADTVTASYPRGDLRHSTTRQPSRWLLPSLHDGQIEGSPSFAAALAQTAQLATEQEWRVRAAAHAAAQGRSPAEALADDAAVVRAVELLRARRCDQLTRFDGDLSGHWVPVPGQDHLTSPTALESWARCPHGYFLERMLEVKPIEQPEAILFARALEVGSIVHESLDEFHQTHGQERPNRPWTAQDHAALHDIARHKAQEYTQRGLTGHPVLWERELTNVLHALDVLLDQDQAVRAEMGRAQIRSELAFGMKDEPPVELALPSGRTIRVRGSADRVDRAGVDPANAELVVVDYKTGSDWSYRDISEENPTAHGSKLQLPIYARAARAALGKPDTPVAAEYWFVGRSTARIGVPLTDDVERIFISTVDTIVTGIADGLFPQRPPHDDAFGWGCPSCDPDGLGAAEIRRAWSAKRTDPRLVPYLSVVEPS